MALYLHRPKRLVIPRWREFKQTAQSGELAKKSKEICPIDFKKLTEDKYKIWKDNKTILNAIYLVNTAFVTKQFDLAKPAADQIIKCKDKLSEQIIVMADCVSNSLDLSQQLSLNGLQLNNLHELIGAKIKDIRRRVHNFQRNPIAWVDLAMWYTVIGKIRDAERAILSAISLAPGNLFVIRSAVRFFIHKNDPESLFFACKIINDNPCSKSDPWLLATEISLSAFLKKSSKNIKIGFKVFESNNYSPFSLTELGAALATEEMANGANRNSRKLFRKSLSDPNENAIAQAQWASELIGELPINLKIQNTFEASAYSHFKEGNWEKAFSGSVNWILDQPFTQEPVTFASYLAGAIIDNNEKAIEICNFGLKANPKEFGLLNNKAYSLAVSEKVVAAEETFKQIEVNKLKENQKVTYLATKGLIYFMKDDPISGDNFYNEAIQKAEELKNNKLITLSKLFKMRAENLCGMNVLENNNLFQKIESDVKKSKDLEIMKVIENMKKRIF